MKPCRKCKETFSPTQFHKDTSKASGLRNVCKSCDCASTRKYYQTHKRHMRKYRRKWYKTHKESFARYRLLYRQRNYATVMIRSAKVRAELKRIPFDLDQHISEIRGRVALGICELTGMKLDNKAKKAFNTPSLDRIIPSRGYLYSNIRIVSYVQIVHSGHGGNRNSGFLRGNY